MARLASVVKEMTGLKSAAAQAATKVVRQRGQPAIQVSSASSARAKVRRLASGWSAGSTTTISSSSSGVAAIPSGVRVIAERQRDVAVAALQQSQRLRWLRLEQLDPDARVAGAQPAHRRCDDRRARAREGAQAHPAQREMLDGGNLLRGGTQVREDRL